MAIRRQSLGHPPNLTPYRLAPAADPEKRFRGLIAFYKAHGLKAEQEFCEKSLDAMRGQ
jgi:hypothetical protein